jgi:hypothetical protein
MVQIVVKYFMLREVVQRTCMLSVVPHACVSWHVHNQPLLGLSRQASGRAPKDSNSLETSRDNCGVVRDLKNTANQGAQFYMLQQNTPLLCFAVLKGVFRTA